MSFYDEDPPPEPKPPLPGVRFECFRKLKTQANKEDSNLLNLLRADGYPPIHVDCVVIDSPNTRIEVECENRHWAINQDWAKNWEILGPAGTTVAHVRGTFAFILQVGEVALSRNLRTSSFDDASGQHRVCYRPNTTLRNRHLVGEVFLDTPEWLGEHWPAIAVFGVFAMWRYNLGILAC